MRKILIVSSRQQVSVRCQLQHQAKQKRGGAGGVQERCSARSWAVLSSEAQSRHGRTTRLPTTTDRTLITDHAAVASGTVTLGCPPASE